MKNTVFVVSDFHLGGAPAANGAPGFQMCSAHGRQRLAEFFHWLRDRQRREQDTQLVVNGDLVDFLAETEFAAFTGNEDAALSKLNQIMSTTKEVWDALAEYVATEAPVTLLLGNHDIELALPRVRAALLDRLGAGNVTLICDNEAFRVGPLLIEHGNRYDNWNAVPYDNLRQVRSALSRSAPPEFPAMPGSELVVRVMNQIKASHSFVDLLKPEDSAVLPLLAVLDGDRTRRAIQLFRAKWRASQVKYDENQQPVDGNYIAEPPPHPDEDDFALAESLSYGGYDPNNIVDISAIGNWICSFPGRVRKRIDEWKWESEVELLYKAFRRYGAKHRIVFDVDQEDPKYLGAATAIARNGLKVIVYGHTHLAKRQEIQVDGQKALYLNAGTWADLMRLPQAVYGTNEAVARAQLEVFAKDLDANNLGPWRRTIPTFAQIDIDGNEANGDIFFFDGPGKIARVTTEEFVNRFA